MCNRYLSSHVLWLCSSQCSHWRSLPTQLMKLRALSHLHWLYWFHLQGLHLEQRPLLHLQISPQATSVYAFQLWAESHLKSPSSNHGILLSSCDILQLDKDEALINRVLTLCFPYLIFMCSLTFLLQSHQAGTLLEQHADFLNKSWPFSTLPENVNCCTMWQNRQCYLPQRKVSFKSCMP